MNENENTPDHKSTDKLLEGERGEMSGDFQNVEKQSARYPPNYAHISVFMVIMFLSGFTQGLDISSAN